MTRKNKVISGIVLSVILASGLFAATDMDKKGEDKRCDNKCMMKDNRMNKMDNQRAGNFHLFRELNLTAEQETKLEQIMQDSRKNIKSEDEAFSKDGFDKAKYIQIMSEKRDNMLKSQAEVIEKSYAILTTKQKEQLKVLMDLRIEKIKG
ncbi:MAG: Spy/CpxP family protein refolding chaperone [Arcobacteraceae bacterium]|nr:Spy/CpxP family protein refolding chaperone [Campylobacterales bacterium]